MNDLSLPEWPAAERNKGPILEVLERVLPRAGRVLELASGTGQHVVHFAGALRQLEWQPSDRDPENLRVIAERVRRSELTNLRPPLSLDACADPWPVSSADALFNANMIHIAPWDVTLGLFAGAGRVLPPGAIMVTYGPYMLNGSHTAPSNEAFDVSLRARDPRWGVRDLADVDRVAANHGIHLQERVPMPANNLCVVWQKSS